MVAGSRRQGQNPRRTARRGYLFAFLILTSVAYFGVNFGSHYVQYWRFKDAMRQQAARAAGRTDAVIRNRLVGKIQDLELPHAARTSLTVRRSTRPREIRIESSYQVVLELPFHSYVHTFNPRAKQPL